MSALRYVRRAEARFFPSRLTVSWKEVRMPVASYFIPKENE